MVTRCIHLYFPQIKSQDVRTFWRSPPAFDSHIAHCLSLTASSSCIWWWGCEGCGSLWCSWLWGNIRPQGRTRTGAATWTRWFWSGRKQSFLRCSDDALKTVKSSLNCKKLINDQFGDANIRFLSYQLRTGCRQTSLLQQGCRWGIDQGWTPSSPPRCPSDGGWRSERRRFDDPQGWCTPQQSDSTDTNVGYNFFYNLRLCFFIISSRLGNVADI